MKREKEWGGRGGGGGERCVCVHACVHAYITVTVMLFASLLLDSCKFHLEAVRMAIVGILVCMLLLLFPVTVHAWLLCIHTYIHTYCGTVKTNRPHNVTLRCSHLYLVYDIAYLDILLRLSIVVLIFVVVVVFLLRHEIRQLKSGCFEAVKTHFCGAFLKGIGGGGGQSISCQHKSRDWDVLSEN